jgi:hypothetical protein
MRVAHEVKAETDETAVSRAQTARAARAIQTTVALLEVPYQLDIAIINELGPRPATLTNTK